MSITIIKDDIATLETTLKNDGYDTTRWDDDLMVGSNNIIISRISFTQQREMLCLTVAPLIPRVKSLCKNIARDYPSILIKEIPHLPNIVSYCDTFHQPFHERVRSKHSLFLELVSYFRCTKCNRTWRLLTNAMFFSQYKEDGW